jgi:hypothetical protein
MHNRGGLSDGLAVPVPVLCPAKLAAQPELKIKLGFLAVWPPTTSQHTAQRPALRATGLRRESVTGRSGLGIHAVAVCC